MRLKNPLGLTNWILNLISRPSNTDALGRQLGSDAQPESDYLSPGGLHFVALNPQ